MKINHNSNTGISKSLSASTPDYSKFGLKVDEPSECVITNLDSPLGRDETVRYACFEVDNVYKNSGIQIASQQPAKAGIKAVASVKQHWSLTGETGDTDVPDYTLPVTAQVSVTVPRNEYITASDIEQLLLQVVGAMYTAEGSAKILNLLKGSLRP